MVYNKPRMAEKSTNSPCTCKEHTERLYLIIEVGSENECRFQVSGKF